MAQVYPHKGATNIVTTLPAGLKEEQGPGISAFKQHINSSSTLDLPHPLSSKTYYLFLSSWPL